MHVLTIWVLIFLLSVLVVIKLLLVVVGVDEFAVVLLLYWTANLIAVIIKTDKVYIGMYLCQYNLKKNTEIKEYITRKMFQSFFWMVLFAFI